MADEADYALALSGEKDLSQCDLRGADLSGRDLRRTRFTHSKLDNANLSASNVTGSDFRQAGLANADLSNSICEAAQFDGALFKVNFEGADLRGASFQSALLHQPRFVRANLRGAVFRSARFDETADFDQAEYDEATDFEGASALRAIARQSVFEFFEVGRGGILSRRPSNPKPPRSLAESTAAVAPGAVAQEFGEIRRINARIAIAPGPVGNMAASLALAVREQIERLQSELPNEPIQLERHQRFVELLTEIASALNEVAAGLSDEATRDLDTAATRIQRLRDEVYDWFQQNGSWISDYSSKTALLGAGTAFLSFCGAPSLGAFMAASFLVGGRELVEATRSTVTKLK